MAKKHKTVKELEKKVKAHDKIMKKVLVQLDEQGTERVEWHRAYAKEHGALLQAEDTIRKLKEERAKFLEDWYDLSSVVIAKPKTTKTWSVAVNTCDGDVMPDTNKVRPVA